MPVARRQSILDDVYVASKYWLFSYSRSSRQRRSRRATVVRRHDTHFGGSPGDASIATYIAPTLDERLTIHCCVVLRARDTEAFHLVTEATADWGDCCEEPKRALMMAPNIVYQPHYTGCRALVVGINQYLVASPLEFARNDADAISNILIKRFDFPENAVSVLVDEEATKESILSAFHSFCDGNVDPDERIIFFFAGHGHTTTGSRGEVGFLVPFDGEVESVNTLIRWHDLTGAAELIVAKHIFFIVDACYGGTAVQRHLSPGTMRFARDMLRRFSRQVLTAGKANEAVADAGGPRSGHSVFTGHLLDGLEGSAANTDGLITANGLMAHVYDKVARDYQSRQTPHYGFLDGDGDMIFDLSPLSKFEHAPQAEYDILIQVPIHTEFQVDSDAPQTLADVTKEYLSDPRYRIKLHDIVSSAIRKVLADTTADKFPIQGIALDAETFSHRLIEYETTISQLITIVILISRWGDHLHRSLLEMLFSRLRDNQSAANGLVVYLGLQWYPISFLLYAGGIAALAAKNYNNLAAILMAPIQEKSNSNARPIVVPTVEGMLEVERCNAFKVLPGYERYYTPRSEYAYKAVQPYIDDLLFLGQDYDRMFDQFEILLGLIFADLTREDSDRVWGPIGRFGWKVSGLRSREDPLKSIVEEVALHKENSPLLKAGLFGGSFSRFEEIASGYRDLLAGLRWF